ncbi:MAG: Gfo/Idh/MocA family oxidoreductase [Planctomycetes bacterium]|nr:Gfo/Idh/MocA family oxidoreductase [Planctomycetota bacterium]
MKRYRVAQVGAGNRGVIHLDGFRQLADRFEVVALCDLDAAKLAGAAERFAIPATYADADTMLDATRPDVFCFVTPPDVRLPMVELAARHRVRGLAFEKPMATSLAEARAIADLCAKSHLKAVVSHQQKYLASMRKLKSLVDSGEVGEVSFIRATCVPWLSQLGTHYMDYTLWINGGHPARWVVGHVHGKGRLADSHPSPDFVLGEILFDNGVRATIECGYLSPHHMDADHFWVDDRLTVYGTHGYAWADTNNRWGAFTRSSGGEPIGGEGEEWLAQERTHLQPLYLADLADWLDDETRVHPCHVGLAYHGYEILEGLCLSALEHTRIDLPLDARGRGDLNERMRHELPDVPPLPGT